MGAITEAFKNEYNDVLMHLVQQQDSLLTGTTLVDTNFTGEAKYYDQLGQTSVTQRTSRNQATPIIDPSHDKRKLTGAEYIHAYVLDKIDELSMAVNPRTGYVRSQAMAFARQTDKVIYTALLGTAYSTKAGTTSNSISNTVTALSGLTVDKILETKQLLDEGNVDPMEKRYMAITALEIRDLLNTTEVKSSDYNTVKALAAGDIDTFCGFKFIKLPATYTAAAAAITNGIITRNTSTNVNNCVAWCETGLMLGIKKDLETRITEESTMNFSVQIWASKIMGAVRLEEAKVVAVNVTNT